MFEWGGPKGWGVCRTENKVQNVGCPVESCPPKNEDKS